MSKQNQHLIIALNFIFQQFELNLLFHWGFCVQPLFVCCFVFFYYNDKNHLLQIIVINIDIIFIVIGYICKKMLLFVLLVVRQVGRLSVCLVSLSLLSEQYVVTNKLKFFIYLSPFSPLLLYLCLRMFFYYLTL